uniref:Uncharacterized protein n=1 Tax=viral metagenome TaxID=1070528 RepID=A0A6C0CCA7_9ZZZZ
MTSDCVSFSINGILYSRHKEITHKNLPGSQTQLINCNIRQKK